MASFFSVSSVGNAADLAATLTPASISYLSINTNKSSGVANRNIAILATSAGALQGGCSGVWLDSGLDKSAYSMLLAAISTQKTINIYYDPAQPSPWGNVAWCALTLAWITP
jgi:hypothetical protein